MLFRRATESDFAEYVRLYNDPEAETIYRKKEDEEINPQKQQEALKYFGLDDPNSDFVKQLEKENRRTFPKFLKDITNSSHRIIIIQNSYRVVGFIELFMIKRFCWKIAFLCIEQRYQTLEVINHLMQYLRKEENMHQLDVCTYNGDFDDMLKAAGFISDGFSFLHKTLDG